MSDLQSDIGLIILSVLFGWLSLGLVLTCYTYARSRNGKPWLTTRSRIRELTLAPDEQGTIKIERESTTRRISTDDLSTYHVPARWQHEKQGGRM